MILGGDDNFTLLVREVWGSSARMKHLASFFNNLFQGVVRVGMELMSLMSTWRNGRDGIGGIAKRLDRFYMSENLVYTMHMFRSWVVPSNFSNHMLIVLQIDFGMERIRCPFKFNNV